MEQHLGDWIQSVTAVSQNRVLALTLSGTAWLLDEETGAVHWSSHVEGRPTGAPAVADGRACIGTADGTVHVLDLDNTRWLRRFTMDGRVTACLAAGRTVIVAGPSLRALAPRTGAVSWDKPIAGTVPHGLAAQGGVVHVGTATGHVHALDVSSGTVRRAAWSIRQRVLVVAPGTNDAVFVAGAGGGVPSPPSRRITAAADRGGRRPGSCVPYARRCSDERHYSRGGSSRESQYR